MLRLWTKLCSCRLMISQHHDVEAKVVAELDALGLLITPSRPQPRAMTFEDITALEYTICAIKVCSGLRASCASNRCCL